uniref:UBN2 domain-containing protein n=1 Tax=Tanacetum cinerariifolium TaxID=118510 RepID=A0A6L2KBZ7_TANCI|nr:hypothetical protein [Tanacetum cinerariifolium]
MKETPYELLKDEQKKQLGKNNEAKINLYNALPRKEAKVMAIKEAKDLAILLLDELVRNLKVYEMILDNDDTISKTTTKENVKSLALKAEVTRDQPNDDSDSQDGSDEDVDEEEAEAFNLLARNFRKFFRKGTLLVSVESQRRTRILWEEHGAIVKTAMNIKTTQHECLMEIDSQEVVSKTSSSNIDLNIIDLQKENEEL